MSSKTLYVCRGTAEPSSEAISSEPQSGGSKQISIDGVFYSSEKDEKGTRYSWTEFDKRGPEDTFKGIPMKYRI